MADPGAEDRLPRGYALVLGGAFAALLLVAAVVQLPDRPVLVVVGTLVGLAAAVPAFARPSWQLPLNVAVAGAGAAAVAWGNPSNVGWFTLCLLVAWCFLAGSPRLGIAALVVSLVVLGVQWTFTDADAGWASWLAGVAATALSAGFLRRQRVLVAQLEAAQAELAERSRAEERERLARELHDVLAHSLAVSLLHISSARLAVEHDPADAARALAEAERLGRASLAEVRSIVRLPGSPADGHAPVPTAPDVPALVDRVRAAGVDVEVRIDGDLDALPATTGVTLYRIVQESLTNAAKHAARAPVSVTVDVGPGAVDVVVDSAGPPGSGGGSGVGSGVEGMRQRAEAVGGSCAAGPGGRGWVVRAHLPLVDVTRAAGRTSA